MTTGRINQGASRAYAPVSRTIPDDDGDRLSLSVQRERARSKSVQNFAVGRRADRRHSFAHVLSLRETRLSSSFSITTPSERSPSSRDGELQDLKSLYSHTPFWLVYVGVRRYFLFPDARSTARCQDVEVVSCKAHVRRRTERSRRERRTTRTDDNASQGLQVKLEKRNLAGFRSSPPLVIVELILGKSATASAAHVRDGTAVRSQHT